MRHEILRTSDDEGDAVLFVVRDAASPLPANGGLRLAAYCTEEDAVRDGLGLAGRMTVKHALYNTGFSGAKLVAKADPRKVDRRRLLAVVADALNRQGGGLYTGCDLNTTSEDMRLLHALSPFVLSAVGTDVDPSLATAHGVYGSLRRAVEEEIRGKRFLVHGLGKVGRAVADMLVASGGAVHTYDIQPPRAEVAGCHNVSGSPAWWRAPVDVLVLCSTTGVVGDEAAQELACGLVISGANCPFEGPSVEEILRARSIRWVPDPISNSGAVICDSIEHHSPDRFRRARPHEIYAFVERTVHHETDEFLRLARDGAATHEACLEELLSHPPEEVCGRLFRAPEARPSETRAPSPPPASTSS